MVSNSNGVNSNPCKPRSVLRGTQVSNSNGVNSNTENQFLAQTDLKFQTPTE